MTGGKTLLGIRQSRIYQHEILVRRRFVSLYPDCHARKIIIQLLKPRKHVLFFQYLMNAHRVLCSHVHLLPQPGCKTFQFNFTSQAHCTSEYNFSLFSEIEKSDQDFQYFPSYDTHRPQMSEKLFIFLHQIVFIHVIQSGQFLHCLQRNYSLPFSYFTYAG